MSSQSQIQKNKFAKTNINLSTIPKRNNIRTIQPNVQIKTTIYDNKLKSPQNHHHITNTTLIVPKKLPFYQKYGSSPIKQVKNSNGYQRFITAQRNYTGTKNQQKNFRQVKQAQVIQAKSKKFQMTDLNQVVFLRNENRRLIQQNTVLKIDNNYLNDTINRLKQLLEKKNFVKNKVNYQDSISTEYLQYSIDKNKQQIQHQSRIKRIKSQNRFNDQKVHSDSNEIQIVKCCKKCYNKLNLTSQQPTFNQNILKKKQQYNHHYSYHQKYADMQKKDKRKHNLDKTISQLKQENNFLKNHIKYI